LKELEVTLITDRANIIESCRNGKWVGLSYCKLMEGGRRMLDFF
jgi:hypothetical protein